MKKIAIHDYSGSAFTFQLAEFLATKESDIFYFHGGAMQAVQRAKLNSNKPNLYIDSVKIQRPFSKYQFQKRWVQEIEYGNNLANKLKQINPDLIISATTPLDAQNIILEQINTKKTNFVFWWQDISSLLIKNILMRKNPLLGWLIGEYYLSMERRQLRQSQRVIAIAEEFRAPYRAWGLDESKFHVLPNWAPLEELPLLPKDNPWARRFGLQDKFVFLYSGALALKHNPALLLALADSLRARPEALVVVVSQGPGADWLSARPRPNLLLLPFQSYADYPQVLASADVLLAVLEEHAGSYSVPSKTMSYLCAGRPILLSAPPGNQAARLVMEQNAGLVAAPGAGADYCALAARLAASPDVCENLGQNGRNYAEKTFDIGTIAGRFREIIF
jgi:glycosyltransferase involved in cell wall biosynthesis